MQPYHRHALLQAIIARGFLPLTDARSLYMKLTGAQDGARTAPYASPLSPRQSSDIVFVCLCSGRLRRLYCGRQRGAEFRAVRDQRAAVPGACGSYLPTNIIHICSSCMCPRVGCLTAAPSQVDNEGYVGFVNKVSDPAARLLTSRYSHEQLAYFGALVRTAP